MISCILLSAGHSQRFGHPKALAIFNKKPLIEHIENILIQSPIDEIIIVLGAYSNEILPYVLKDTKIKAIFNKDYPLGQTSSFKSGLKETSSDSLGIMLLPVDYPFIKNETLKLLIDSFFSQKPQILIPTYKNRKGHPLIFSANLKAEFLDLDNSIGVNSIAQDKSRGVALLAVDDPAVISTFNTPEEFEKLKIQFSTL